MQHLNKKFWLLAILIILFGLVTRVYAVHGNNIFFTVDEGRDAVYVRQIINHHQIFTKGPESSVRGIFTGPLWYYFIAIGYTLMHGNPTGAVSMLVLLNLSITLVLMWVIKQEVDAKLALVIGFGLQIFWPFFTTSLWGFNPFPLVALSIFLIILLIKNKYGLALIPILLAFNTELAGAIAFLFFYEILISASYAYIFLSSKKVNLKKYLLLAFIIPGIGAVKITFDYLRQPKATTNSGLKVLAGTNFRQMAVEFYKMGAGFFLIILVLYIFIKNKNKFSRSFIYLTTLLITISYFFFASNHGWREWHTVYIPVLTFVAALLMCWELKRIGKILICIILVLQILFFTNNFQNYLKPSPNPSLLYNQEKVLDWIYTHNEGNGFNLYTYTNSFYDYSYQYLISWYSLPKYGFYPCEYSNFPLSIKDFYIPGWRNYVEPKLGCDKFRFLIIDSNTNGNQNKNWINDFRSQTILVDKTQIGNTFIEKRKVPDKIK